MCRAKTWTLKDYEKLQKSDFLFNRKSRDRFLVIGGWHNFLFPKSALLIFPIMQL